jgi:predicted nucleic acid-binding protein
MRWLLDTNVLINAFAGETEAVALLQQARAGNAEWIGYSAVSRLEVLGFSGLSPADEGGLRQLMAEFQEAQITAPVIDRAIELRKASRIKIPDALIAATAFVYDATLVTRNERDFRSIAGLRVLDLPPR